MSGEPALGLRPVKVPGSNLITRAGSEFVGLSRDAGAVPVRVAVLLACHNRRDTTVACLESLDMQRLDGSIELEAFLVDDGSTDGTSEAVRRRFDWVEVSAGTGDLFWGGGMRQAWRAALKRSPQYSYYLWLNDDVVLRPDALQRLLGTMAYRRGSDGLNRTIVVGTMVDPNSGVPSYGGFRRLWPLPFLRPVRPGKESRPCATMNGNCVLIPETVARAVGTIDPGFTHLRGDLDYGFRARRRGFEVLVAPGIFGECPANPISAWHLPGAALGERIDRLRGPKYDISEKARFAKRHFGVLWWLALAAPFAMIASRWSVELIRRVGRPPGGLG